MQEEFLNLKKNSLKSFFHSPKAQIHFLKGLSILTEKGVHSRIFCNSIFFNRKKL